MPEESKLELKVGLFMMIALIALTIFIFSVTDSTVFEEGKSLKVVFGFANGLKKNAPVRVAGVDEGIVKNIKLFFDREERKTKVEVELKIQKSTKIPSDSRITINQLGLLGEKYVEIKPGLETKRFYREGEVVIGKDPVAQYEISEKVMGVADKLDKTIAGFNEILLDERNQTSVSETLANLSAMTGGLKAIIRDMQAGKGTVGKLLYDELLYDDLQALTADLKENPWKLLYRPKGKKK